MNNELIIDLIEKDCISVQNNNIKMKLDDIISYQYLVNMIVKQFNNKTKFKDINNILGISHLGKHLASVMSYSFNIPLLCISGNKNKKIIGKYEDNANCLVITDSLTDIFDLLNNLNSLKKNMINVTDICSVYCINNFNVNLNLHYIFSELELKRNLVANDFIKLDKYDFESRYKIISNKILKKVLNLIKIKNSYLAYYCEISAIKELLIKVDQIGKDIILLVIKPCIIENFTKSYGIALKKLSNKHNFMIVVDNGLSNINYINKDELEWVDIMTIYPNNFAHSKNLDSIALLSLKSIYKDNDNIIGQFSGFYKADRLNISSKISSIDEIKKCNFKNFDLVLLGQQLINEKVFNFINKSMVL